MPYTLAQAAKATGRDRSTLAKAIRTGKLSAIRDEARGVWLVEPAELHRVYAAVHSEAKSEANSPTGPAHSEAASDAIRVRDDMIADLRARLDRSEAERLAAQARVMALLSEKQAPVPAAVPAGRGWQFWRR